MHANFCCCWEILNTCKQIMLLTFNTHSQCISVVKMVKNNVTVLLALKCSVPAVLVRNPNIVCLPHSSYLTSWPAIILPCSTPRSTMLFNICVDFSHACCSRASFRVYSCVCSSYAHLLRLAHVWSYYSHDFHDDSLHDRFSNARSF